MHAQILGKVLTHADNIEMVGIDKRDYQQRNNQVHNLVPSAQHHGEMTYFPRGQRLGHFVAVRQKAGHTTDDVAEHNAHQRHHHGILELNALDEPYEDPRAQYREDKGEQRPAHNGRSRQKQQRQQNAEARRCQRSACGGGDKLVHAQLLHDQPRNAHAHTRAEDSKQPGQTGNQEKLKLLRVTRKQFSRRHIHNANEERKKGNDGQQQPKRYA